MMSDLRTEDVARLRRAFRHLDSESPLAPSLNQLGGQSADSSSTDAGRASGRRQGSARIPGSKGVLVSLAVAVLVLLAVGLPSFLGGPAAPVADVSDTSPVGSPTTVLITPSTLPGEPAASPVVSMSVYVLEVAGMSLEGADIHHEPDGTAVSFGWTGTGRSVNITTFKPLDENSPKAAAIGKLSADPTRVDDVEFGGLTVDHSYHADNDLHTFIWWEDGAVTRLTARSFGPDLPDLLGSLIKHDINDAVVQAMVNAPEWSPTVYLLDRAGMAFDGGEISYGSGQTVVGLSWIDVNRHVSVMVVGPMDEQSAEWDDFVGEFNLDHSEEEVDFGSLTVLHSYEFATDMHMYQWWEDQTAVRVVAQSFGPEDPGLLEDLVRSNMDAATSTIDQARTLDVPPGIAASMDSPVSSLLFESGRRLTSSESRDDDGLRFESAVFSNGTGLVELIWQDWPDARDLHSVLSDDTTIEQSNGLEVTVRQHAEDNMIEVGVFDGSIYARAYTTFTEDLDLADMRELALMLHQGLTSVRNGP